jgi:hypothetical protein
MKRFAAGIRQEIHTKGFKTSRNMLERYKLSLTGSNFSIMPVLPFLSFQTGLKHSLLTGRCSREICL